ncbi:MAG: hypothetical protein H6686_12285 [Fibrobacteria bacterium]|nr:hypothetical protein [Fibrobacteria bacterium]
MSDFQNFEDSIEVDPDELHPGVESWRGSVCGSCGSPREESDIHCRACGSEKVREIPDVRNGIDRGRSALMFWAALAALGFVFTLFSKRTMPWEALSIIVLCLGLRRWSRSQPEAAFLTSFAISSATTFLRLLVVLSGKLVGILGLVLLSALSILLYQAWRASRDAKVLGIPASALQ